MKCICILHKDGGKMFRTKPYKITTVLVKIAYFTSVYYTSSLDNHIFSQNVILFIVFTSSRGVCGSSGSLGKD